MKNVEKLIRELRAAREEHDGAAVISPKQVATIIRERLKVCFPGVRFSVKSERRGTVYVSWTDGPCSAAVDKVVGVYAFGGFDGSIDMAYSCKNWLLPDGSMQFAETRGTQGSRGYIPEGATDCPVPGAVLVKFGPKYVFTRRTESEHLLRELAREYSVKFGEDYDDEKPVQQQYTKWGDNLAYVVRRYEADQWKESTADHC